MSSHTESEELGDKKKENSQEDLLQIRDDDPSPQDYEKYLGIQMPSTQKREEKVAEALNEKFMMLPPDPVKGATLTQSQQKSTIFEPRECPLFGS